MIYCLRHKSSVKFDRIGPAGFRILGAIDRASETVHHDLLISCGTEDHPSADPHTTGEAYDVSVSGLAPNQIVQLKIALEDDLGPLFTVLYESPTRPVDSRLAAIVYLNRFATAPHIHVQRKKGTVYPPLQIDPIDPFDT